MLKTLNLHQIIKRGLRLLNEGGITRRSIKNFNTLTKHLTLDRMTLYYTDSATVRVHTEWSGYTGYTDVLFTWEFTGLSAGYGGEGPRGFKQILDKMNELGYTNTFNPFAPIKNHRVVYIYK